MILNQHTTHSIDELNTDRLLREMHFGVREALPRGTTVEQAKIIKMKEMNVDSIEDTAEDFEQLLNRQRTFLSTTMFNDLKDIRLSSKSTEEDVSIPRFLVVSHGGFIKQFLNNFTNFKVTKIENCSATIVDIIYDGENGDLQCTVNESQILVTNYASLETNFPV